MPLPGIPMTFGGMARSRYDVGLCINVSSVLKDEHNATHQPIFEVPAF